MPTFSSCASRLPSIWNCREGIVSNGRLVRADRQRRSKESCDNENKRLIVYTLHDRAVRGKEGKRLIKFIKTIMKHLAPRKSTFTLKLAKSLSQFQSTRCRIYRKPKLIHSTLTLPTDENVSTGEVKRTGFCGLALDCLFVRNGNRKRRQRTIDLRLCYILVQQHFQAQF